MKYSRLIFLLTCLFALPAVSALEVDKYTGQRQAMVEEIATDARRLVKYIDKDALSSNVMQVMATVPRHLFMPAEMRASAY